MLAHVPDINDFVAGMKLLLKPDGVITMEFPHLMRLMELNQFDTIYHEHFSYLVVHDRGEDLRRARADDVRRRASSRRTAARCASTRATASDASKPVGPRVQELLRHARPPSGLSSAWRATRSSTSRCARPSARCSSSWSQAKQAGKRIVGYGAPGKGNTLLNYCGIRTDFLDFTVDRNPYKQGKYTPGTHIPILAPERLDGGASGLRADPALEP